MTPKRLEEEIQRDPYIPLRIHLASGKTVKIPHSGAAWVLSYGLLVFHNTRPGVAAATSFDVIKYRLIEKIEQLRNGNGRPKRS